MQMQMPAMDSSLPYSQYHARNSGPALRGAPGRSSPALRSPRARRYEALAQSAMRGSSSSSPVVRSLAAAGPGPGPVQDQDKAAPANSRNSPSLAIGGYPRVIIKSFQSSAGEHSENSDGQIRHHDGQGQGRQRLPLQQQDGEEEEDSTDMRSRLHAIGLIAGSSPRLLSALRTAGAGAGAGGPGNNETQHVAAVGSAASGIAPWGRQGTSSGRGPRQQGTRQS